MNQIVIEEVVSPGCKICHVVEEYWESIAKDFPNVIFKRIDVQTPEGTELAGKHMILASPGIIINGDLFSVGGFDQDKFLRKLKELSSN